jgi:Flp pilus assembly protein TadD
MRLALLFLLAISSVATARETTLPAPDSALHGYVLGRYASADDQADAANRYFSAALAGPDRSDVARRAFDVALAAGGTPRAVQLARQLAATGSADSEVSLVLLADAINRRDWTAATKARAGIASAGYATVLEPIVAAWMLHAQGDHDAALARLDPALLKGFARSYVAEQRAHMLAANGDFETASLAYGDLRAGTRSGFALLRLGEADALAMAGDTATALRRLEGDDPSLVAARRKLDAGRRIGALAPDARHGLGWTMARLATDLSREQPTDLALVFARVATMLSPDVAANWLVLGDVLAAGDRNAAALQALDRVPADDPMVAAARGRQAEVLEAMGRDTDAGALLAAAAEAPDAGPEAWLRLGDWHRRADRFAEAAVAYERAIAVANTAGADDWGLYFLRGTMKERLGDWPGAEADLRAALQRAPDEPVVLNYLGYSLLDRGVTGAEPAALIDRAAKLRPGDGGITDSLGWSQFRAGRFADAVTTLEKAATLEPGDPAIIDHLGDAYWQTGRRIEARFRWQAALALEPDAKLQAALQQKLAVGLDAALALAALGQ